MEYIQRYNSHKQSGKGQRHFNIYTHCPVEHHYPLSVIPMWDAKVAKKVEGKSSARKVYSAKVQPCKSVQGSARPSLDRPSLGLLSLSIHSIQALQPRPCRRTWESWEIRCTSSGLLAPRIREEAAASLSMNHRRSKWRRTILMKPWYNDPTKCYHQGRFVDGVGANFPGTDGGTTQCTPNRCGVRGKTNPTESEFTIFSLEASL